MRNNDRPIDHVLKALEEPVHGAGSSWSARCPAHDDRNPSLSVSEGDDGRALVYCHAGCETTDVVKALGLEMSDLMPPMPMLPARPRRRSTPPAAAEATASGPLPAPPLPAPPSPPRRIVATYDYRDECGKLQYQVVRYEPKEFRQRRPDGNGGWIWNVGDTRRVLYRLHELLEAKRQSASPTVFVVEGEKDADRLAREGLISTTCAQGAGKWKQTDDSALEGCHAVIVPDNDAQGLKHAEQVAAALHGRAASVRVVALPGLPEKGDVSDWLDVGHTVSELRELVEKTSSWAPEESHESGDAEPAEDREDATARLCSDVGNAARFVHQHRGQFRWCCPQGQWYVWGGTHWAIDDREKLLAAAKDTALTILEEARAEASDSHRAELIRHAGRSQNRERLKAMVELAKPELAIVTDEFDGDPWLFNCANGTLDLRTGTLREHDPEDSLTKLSNVVYDEEAAAPTWEVFINRIFDGDADLIGYVQRLLGSMLTGDISEQILPVFWGQGANGKSTLLDAVVAVLGDYADSAAPDLLMQRSSDEHPTELADLMGKRLVVASESEKNRKLKIQLVKRLTGDEKIKARFMRQDYFTFTRQFKLILVTNNKPRVDEDSEAVWRRLRLVPFTVVIPEKERDPRLLEKLKAEASGILRWLVEGCLAWQRDGLCEPSIVKSVTGEYRKESNPIEQFFEECCVFEDGAWEASRILLETYRQWCAEAGEEPESDREFFNCLRRHGCRDGRKERTTRGWCGIRLLQQTCDTSIVGRIPATMRGCR
jgi:putative DNA primase/helicase